MATYKAVMRPALEYASSIWSPVASSTSINKVQNAALRTATRCTQDINIQHLHDKTLILPIQEHLQLHASQYKQETQHPSHPLHKHTTNIPTDPHTVTTTAGHPATLLFLIFGLIVFFLHFLQMPSFSLFFCFVFPLALSKCRELLLNLCIVLL